MLTSKAVRPIPVAARVDRFSYAIRNIVAEARAEYVQRFASWREQLAASWRGEGLSYTMAVVSEAPSRVVRRVASVA